MLDADQLVLRYGDVTAVDRLSFTIAPGEVLGVIGPNGAGKTSTIHMCTGILPPTEGEVRIGGEALKRDRLDLRARIGYVPDRPDMYASLTGLEYVQFVAGLHGVDEKEATRRARPLFERFRLADRAGRMLESYSHGMRQKVLITAAVVHEPDLLVLDEPIVGLDPHAGRVLREVIAERTADGAAVFFSTHVLQIAEQVADRVLLLEEGRALAEGTMGELRARASADAGDDLERLFFRLTETADRAEGRS